VAAFEEWAPVECLEPAPLSLARGLGKDARGSYAVAAGPDERGWVEVAGGRVRSARRVSVDAAFDPPAAAEIAGDFVTATGAARGVDDAVDSMLVTDAFARRLHGRRLRRLAGAAALCATSLVLALWAVDRSRERVLARIRAEVTALTPQAQPGLDLQNQLAAIDREAAALRELASQRPDPLRVLAALSARLPREATVLSVKAVGDDWQIDGTSPDAAAIVPLLDKDDRFEGVRFLSASSRFREGNRSLETFSIAFRVRPGA
jgi:hypothetical protein